MVKLILIESTPYIAWILAIIITTVLAKFLKKEFDQDRLQNVLSEILDLILDAEDKFDTGAVKKDYVVKVLEKQLDSGKKRLIDKVYGSVPKAIEWVFQTVVQPNLKPIFKHFKK